MRLRFSGVALFLVASFVPALAQNTSPSLSSTVAGRRVEAYLRAFNTGSDSTMRAFFADHLAKDAHQRIPLAQRMERYHQLRSTAETFTLKKVLEVREDRAVILADTRPGLKFRMTFHFEQAPPHGLIVIEMEEAEAGDEEITRARNDAGLVRAVREYVGKLADADEFSGVVLIAKNGAPLFQQAYGMADKEKKIPNELTTRFNVGSMNKSFTTVAIHQLAAGGRLSFNDPLKKILPAYPNGDAAEKVTVQHLLDMSSGIGDFFGERYDATPKEKINSINDYLPLFADKPLAFEPGAQRQYSNGGFIVLGAIIEKLSGMDYYSYVRKNILIPAGMMATDWYEKSSPLVARGYTRARGAAPDALRQGNYDSLPWRGSSAGGGYSTAPDLLKYTLALQSGPMIPPTVGARQGLGIAGGTEGVNAALEWNPKNGYTIIVLSNYDPPIAERIARRIRALLPEA
jgi:CubicO group peptidase (beta-lactamase class C family)